MKVKVAKWGNSLAVRVPKHVADELGLAPGQTVDLQRQGNQLRIETVQAPKIPQYRLEDLLAQIKPGQKPPPCEDWSAIEPSWPDDDWSDVAPTAEEWEAVKREAEVKSGRRRRRA
jgi:antitoxin MazE